MKKILFFILFFPLYTYTQTSVHLQLDSIVRSVPEMGFNGNTIRGPSWVNTEFNDSVASMFPKVLRYPGGGVARSWNWDEGWFYNQAHLDTVLQDTAYLLSDSWYNLDAIDIRPIRFQEALNQTNSEGVFVMNMVTSDLSSQIRSLDSAIAQGVVIKKIELGSEFNHDNVYCELVFPTAGDYARACNVWIDSIRCIIPNVEIALVAGNFASSNRAAFWNDSLYAIVNDADALIWHQYLYLHNDDTIYTNEQVLAYPFYKVPRYEKWRAFQDTIVALQDYEIWITEYGFHDKTDDKHFANTWAHALIHSGMNNLLIENNKVEMLLHHNVGGIFPTFDALDTQNGFSKRMVGISNTIWNQQMIHATSTTQIASTFSYADTVNYYNSNGLLLDVAYSKLFAWKFENTERESAIVVNISADTIFVDVDAVFLGGNVLWKKWTTDSLYAHLDSISHPQITVDIGIENIAIPPYSINVASAEICSHATYSQEVFICEGDSVLVGASTYLQEGNYTDTLIGFLGCDSVVLTQLNFHLENIPTIIVLANDLSTEQGMSNYQWYLDGVLLAGANAHNLIATTSGEYMVSYIDENGCFDTSASLFFDVSHIQPFAQEDFRLQKIVDVLGRETIPSKKQLLFYIYKNGVVEKKIVLD